MPSGSKKRKAAKKKKGNQSNGNTDPSSASHHSHGGDELKIRGNKETDGGEENSNLPSVEENVAKIEREFEEKDKSDNKDSSSSDNSSNSSSSSSSSSDDEEIVNKEISPVVEAIVTDTIEEEKGELVEENPPIVESEGKNEIEEMNSPPEHSTAAYVVESESKEEIEETNSPPDNSVAPCVVEESFEDKIVISAPAIETKEVALVPSVEDTAKVLLEHEKDSGVTKPLLAPDSRAVETTSWKSCCGLFEVFSGSGR